MLNLFTHALDHQLWGTAAYLDTVQDLFAQDESSGLLEVLGEDQASAVFLYFQGNPFAAYRMVNDRWVAFDPQRPYDALPAGEMDIRYLMMPTQAVRVVWQALEWYPAERGAQIDSQALGSYLDALKLESAAGILHLTLPDRDGFLLLEEGVPVSAETIFASARGFEDLLPDMHGARELAHGPCSAWLYEPKPGTKTAELSRLRLAQSRWTLGIVNGYLMLVGSSLVGPLNYEINTFTRHSHWNIRLVGGAMIDNHLFTQVQEAADAYRKILVAAVGHMAKVVGDNLTQRTLDAAYKKLPEDYQRALEAQHPKPAEISPR